MKHVIRDTATGRVVEFRGADSMKSAGLVLLKGVDLTRPIAEQVMRHQPPTLRKQDESD